MGSLSSTGGGITCPLSGILDSPYLFSVFLTNIQNKGAVNYHNKRSHIWPSSHRLYQKSVNRWYSPLSPCSVICDVTHFISQSPFGSAVGQTRAYQYSDQWDFCFVEPMLTVITDQEINVCHQLRSCPLIRNRLHVLITMACFTCYGC